MFLTQALFVVTVFVEARHHGRRHSRGSQVSLRIRTRDPQDPQDPQEPQDHNDSGLLRTGLEDEHGESRRWRAGAGEERGEKVVLRFFLFSSLLLHVLLRGRGLTENMSAQIRLSAL